MVFFGVIGEVTLQLIDNTYLSAETFTCSSEYYLENTLHPKLIYQHAEFFLDDMQTIVATNYYETKQKRKLTRNKLMSQNREKELTFWDPKGSDALLGFFIPLHTFHAFKDSLHEIIKKSRLHIFKCSLNYLPGNQDAFLSPPFQSCVKLALFYRQIQSNKSLNEAFKNNCSEALAFAKGSPYLTFDYRATAKQMDLFYPNWKSFLKKKLEYDPKEIFYNQFYNKLKLLLT